jgi:hypothetical protein
MFNQLLPNGLKHELSKRWTPRDWILSKSVSRLIDTENSDQVIATAIKPGKPTLIGRLGGTEARFIGEYLKITQSKFLKESLFEYKANWKKRSFEINNNAGFYFKDLSDIERFFELYDESLKSTDVLGAWGTAFAWVESRYLAHIKHFVPVGHTAPWVNSYNIKNQLEPWSNILSGKTVLVVSPFYETFSRQHLITNKLFFQHSYPKFELTGIVAPLTFRYAPNSQPTWFDRLDDMKEQIEASNFDIALISAGSYSFPLALHAKKLGKIGIHAGGGLQLFFGVMGKRWENQQVYEYTNKSLWTRPSKTETPTNAKNVENGCYW